MEPRRLSVIEGGRCERRAVGGVELVLVDEECVTGVERLMVVEEDTHLVLSAPPELPEQAPVPLRVLTAALETEPHPLGRLVFGQKRWFAVIHDLDQEPSTNEACVRSLFRQVFDIADVRGHARLALQALGSVHGPLTAAQSLLIVCEELVRRPLENLERIDFVVPSDRKTRADLERLLGGSLPEVVK